MKLNSENNLINAIGFQLSWWLVALYQERFTFVVVGLVFAHLIFLKSGRLKELCFVLMVTIIGVATDSLLVHFGVLAFDNLLLPTIPIVPLWMIVLWLAFSCSLNHCLAWIFKKPVITFFAGGIGGSLSYIAATKFGAIEILLPKELSFVILSLVWGILFLLLRCIYLIKKKKSWCYEKIF